MGGTFNPIHYGHLLVAEDARTYCNLDEIIFIPSGNSYMKDTSEIIDGKKRYEMVSLAIAGNTAFSISDMEIKRNGHTYTYETLEELNKIYPDTDFYFILGADNLFTIEKWKYADKIMQNCTLIVASRDEKDKQDLTQKANSLFKSFHATIEILPERKIDLSSTEIRKKIRENKPVIYMTPQSVISYINKNALYHS
ncbi:MAG: nicotinate-nucleotide adenylyltransferase [Lachnospiraceae bacterium]|nr:nicotinate-nucleotide adenylyltransferase [Lachnospiraceae bacterium]